MERKVSLSASSSGSALQSREELAEDTRQTFTASAPAALSIRLAAAGHSLAPPTSFSRCGPKPAISQVGLALCPHLVGPLVP